MLDSPARYILASFAALCLLASSARAATVSDVFDGGVACLPLGDVQFCSGTLLTRVESWDGVPLDVNVTIPPAAMDGPFPLIVSLHGWGIGKDQQPATAQAMDGYVVLSYSARGFHNSCGFPTARLPDLTLSNPSVCNERGWIRLADARYEIRDTQYLAGVLVDEGLVIPGRIGATGSSYGGGQSMLLAALRNRIMLENGALVPWTSPLGTPMELAAAAPLIPWSDLAHALVPNGRTLDTQDFNPYGTRVGVAKQSWIESLYTLGLVAGFYAPSGADPDADLPGWKTRLDQGEPYDGDPLVEHVIDQVTSFHSAYYIDDSVEPAPMVIYNAFTDDLFPGDEALRMFLKTKAVHPSAEISVVLADGFGHMRASLTGDQSAAQARVDELFERHLKGAGGSPTLPAVETYTQACTGSTETGPFTGNTWDDVHPAEIVFSDAAVRIFTEAAGSALTALVTDPVAGGLTSCRTTSDADDAAASTYRLPAATGAGYTLMGSPRVSAVFDITGADPDFAQVVARLWDVGTNGQQALVTQALYRPEVGSSAPQTFILHPNGWHFVDGHVAKLELLGQSVPYGRASNGGWTVAVSDLQLVLPVAEISSGGGPLACAPAPVAGCKGMTVSGGASLAMKDRPGGGDRLVWKMRKVDATTPADLGDPLSDTGYTLCSYDATGEIITAHLVPSAGTCGNGKPCWKTFSRGYKYRDRESTPDGIFAAKLQSGEAGKAKLQVKGKGVLLGVPALPVGPLPITVQLIADSGACWEALYSAAAKNDAGGFKARSD